MRYLLLLMMLLPSISAHSATVYLTRHYEKAPGQDPALTERGKARAHALAEYLSDKKIEKVYSTNYQRTLQTGEPVAKQNAIEVIRYAPDELQAMAKIARKSQQNILIVGHSNTTPELISQLGGPNVTISESDYGTLYEITFSDSESDFVRYEITLP